MTDLQYTYRWQLQTQKALGLMLAHGQKAKLPGLMWTLATNGALTGEAISLGSTAAGQRAAVSAWAEYLDTHVRVWERKDGVTELSAHFVWAKDPAVKGAIRATIYPEDEVA